MSIVVLVPKQKELGMTLEVETQLDLGITAMPSIISAFLVMVNFICQVLIFSGCITGVGPYCVGRGKGTGTMSNGPADVNAADQKKLWVTNAMCPMTAWKLTATKPTNTDTPPEGGETWEQLMAT